jgi:hypothetical protein
MGDRVWRLMVWNIRLPGLRPAGRGINVLQQTATNRTAARTAASPAGEGASVVRQLSPARDASAFPIKIIICDDGATDRFVTTVELLLLEELA